MDSMIAALIKQKKEMKVKASTEAIISAAQKRNEFNA